MFLSKVAVCKNLLTTLRTVQHECIPPYVPDLFTLRLVQVSIQDFITDLYNLQYLSPLLQLMDLSLTIR